MPKSSNLMSASNNLPAVGNNIPRRGNVISRKLALWGMKLFGWSIHGELPDANKFVIIGVPHTSNWDFILVIATATALGIRISWMAKNTLFRGLAGPIFKWMGGVAIDRNAPGGVVGDSVSTFNRSEKLILCITPEGTRGKVTTWKSGFYRIVQEANIPLLLATFDYGKKELVLGPVFPISGDYESDLERIKEHYKGVKAKHPQLA